MKRLFVFSLVLGSGILLASCQSQPPVTVTPVTKPAAKPAATPVVQAKESTELTAMQDEISKIDVEKDFPTFSDKDLE